MPEVGYRAHDFGSFGSASALGERIESIRKGCIQLALNKVIPSAKPWEEWDEEYISSVTSVLRKHGVEVAMIGCYINPVHPDDDRRKSEIERFEKSLSLASAFGCPYVGTETGTRNPEGGYSPETSSEKTFSVFLDSLSRMLDAAERHNAFVAMEAVARTHTVSSPERVRKVLETFPTSRLKLILDPVNLIPYTGIPEADGVPLSIPTEEAESRFISDILDLYGSRLVAVHAKDYILDSSTGFKIGNLPALTGCFRWKNFARELRRRNIDVPWLLENHNPLTVKETAETMEKF